VIPWPTELKKRTRRIIASRAAKDGVKGTSWLILVEEREVAVGIASGKRGLDVLLSSELNRMCASELLVLVDGYSKKEKKDSH